MVQRDAHAMPFPRSGGLKTWATGQNVHSRFQGHTEVMLSESEVIEKIRSGGTLRAVAYPWGIELEGGDA